MIISPKLNSLTPQLYVNCSAGSIKIATKVKYLGVIIDDKLNFKDHINFVETKISRSVDILGKLKYYLDHSSFETRLCSDSFSHYLRFDYLGEHLSFISDKIYDFSKIR